MTSKSIDEMYEMANVTKINHITEMKYTEHIIKQEQQEPKKDFSSPFHDTPPKIIVMFAINEKAHLRHTHRMNEQDRESDRATNTHTYTHTSKWLNRNWRLLFLSLIFAFPFAFLHSHHTLQSFIFLLIRFVRNFSIILLLFISCVVVFFNFGNNNLLLEIH